VGWRIFASGPAGRRRRPTIAAALALVAVVSASARASAGDAAPADRSAISPPAVLQPPTFSLVRDPPRSSDKPSLARWTIPALTATLGAAGVVWGIVLLTGHGASSCDGNPRPGCVNGPGNRMEGADLTTAGALLLLGSSAYMVRAWSQPSDRASGVSAARGVIFQAHF
jgi:hypothetical protein